MWQAIYSDSPDTLERVRGIGGWLACVVALALGGAARAETNDAVERAKQHFEAGRALFTLGEYARAAREFEDGNRLAPRPRFLLNLGHCYRHLGDRERALAAYREFVQQVPESDLDRAEAVRFLAELERAAPPAPAPEPVVTPAPPPAPSPAPALVAPVQTPAESVHARRMRRYWWIIPASAVVVVGVALGAYFGSRPSSSEPDCSVTSLGCIDLR